MKGYNILWITLIFLSLQQPRRADAFQCYECENCPNVGENEQKYLKECGAPAGQVTRPTTTTTVASEEVSEEEESEEEEEDVTSAEVEETSSTSTASTTTTSTSTSTSTPSETSTWTSTSTSTVTSTSTSSELNSTLAANTTEVQSTTQGVEAFTSESEDLEGSEEVTTSQEKKKESSWSLFPRSQDAGEVDRQVHSTRPVCYILKVKYDGFEVTNRGCGLAVEDKNITCKMLSKGQPYAECQVCEGDFCNSAPSLKSVFLSTVLVFLVIAFNLW